MTSNEEGIPDPETIQPGRSLWKSAWTFSKKRPYFVLLLLGSTVAGAILGAVLPFGEYSVARRCFGGAIAGFYFALFPLGFRLLD